MLLPIHRQVDCNQFAPPEHAAIFSDELCVPDRWTETFGYFFEDGAFSVVGLPPLVRAIRQFLCAMRLFGPQKPYRP
jgi:hypothetical protein